MTRRCRPASSISSADDPEGARSSPDRTHLVGEVQARTDRRAVDDRLRLEITVEICLDRCVFSVERNKSGELVRFGDGAPIGPDDIGQLVGPGLAHVPPVGGAAGQPHQTLVPGGHFLQDGRGEDVAAALANWLH